jgi:hypothetical protein
MVINTIKNIISPYHHKVNHILIKHWHCHSKYPSLIRKYKNIHEGLRCFVIGNGPSLQVSDLSKIAKEYTFASNRIYCCFDKTNFRPSYYFVGDGGFVSKDYENIRNVSSKATFVGLEDFLSYKNLYKGSDVILYRKVTNLTNLIPLVKPTTDDFVSAGHTVLFEACQFAIYMGFKEIYLLGTDCSFGIGKNHFYTGNASEIKGKAENPHKEEGYKMVLAFGALYRYCESNNIIMRNATRGGMLNSVPKVDFDSFF